MVNIEIHNGQHGNSLYLKCVAAVRAIKRWWYNQKLTLVSLILIMTTTTTTTTMMMTTTTRVVYSGYKNSNQP